MIIDYANGTALFPLCLILLFGSALGSVNFLHISLGTPAVLFTALFAGIFGVRIPQELRQFGILLFGYAVGLQIGPRFILIFKKEVWRYLFIGTVPVLLGLLFTIIFGSILKIPPDLLVGIYSAALTNTSSLAAAIDALGSKGANLEAGIIIAFSCVYPLCLLMVVIGVQIFPRFFKGIVTSSHRKWFNRPANQLPRLEAASIEVKKNHLTNVFLSDWEIRKTYNVTVVAIQRENISLYPKFDSTIKQGDVLSVIGEREGIKRFADALGSMAETRQPDFENNFLIEEVEVSSKLLCGKPLRELQLPQTSQVTVNQIRREELQIFPNGDTVIELGDVLIVSAPLDCMENFIKQTQEDKYLISETKMFSFILGLTIALLIDSIRIPVTGNLNLQTGLGGAGFISGIILGKVGRVGSIKIHIPLPTRNFCRDFGLMIFFAAAGTTAGSTIIEVFHRGGYIFILAGLAVSFLTTISSIFLGIFVCRFSFLETLGTTLGMLNNPPAFAAARSISDNNILPISYVGVYPISLFFKSIISQVFVYFVRSSI